jgi:large subunit ribosomal protein L10
MNRADKQTTVERLAGQFKRRPAVFALDFHGLKVEEATSLRRRVRESGSSYEVVKNTLTARALEGTGLDAMRPLLKGMTGLAYTEADAVTLAKTLSDFAKEVPAVSFKGGLVEGRLLTPREVTELASLPGRNELLARLLSVLQAPVQQLLGLLQAPARDLLLVLKAAAADRERGA